MNTFETSKTFVSHAAFVVFAANRGRCPGDGSSLEGGGVSSEGPSAVAHTSGECVVPGRWRSVTQRPPLLMGDLRFSGKK